jgi:hypothetical protein
MKIVLLIGAMSYVLSEQDARWLEGRIRSTCVDDSHRPLDSDALDAYNSRTFWLRISTLASTRSRLTSGGHTPSDWRSTY